MSHTGEQPKGHLINWGKFYDPFVSILLLGREKSIRKKTIEKSGIKPGDAILDLGCGTGTLTRLAKRQTGERGKVVGVDGSPSMLEVAEKKSSRENLNIEFTLGAMENPPVADAAFDLVLISIALHHLEPDVQRDCIRACSRVLRDTGRLMLIDFDPSQSRGQRLLPHLLAHHGMEPFLADLCAELPQLGFSTAQPVDLDFSGVAAFIAQKA
jgi:ubiquinone/menaquinone biosynthesis C-methylase UbiE